MATGQVKESKVSILTTQYETFTIKEGETIWEMHNRLTSITNELQNIGEDIRPTKQERKVLSIFRH